MPPADPALRIWPTSSFFLARSFGPFSGALELKLAPRRCVCSDYFFIGSIETAIAWVYVTSTLSPDLIFAS
jgi:hypothetical protein